MLKEHILSQSEVIRAILLEYSPCCQEVLKPGARARLFSSLENAVCKDSYRRQCRERPEKPIAPTLASVRILTERISIQRK